MAGINTTPRVLTIRNSSLNAKFESLESKLCGKIIAMKSYFIDELRSLINEATLNKEQNCNISTEETTILKNKIKLLELENKLLKDDVTNRQILQHKMEVAKKKADYQKKIAYQQTKRTKVFTSKVTLG